MPIRRIGSVTAMLLSSILSILDRQGQRPETSGQKSAAPFTIDGAGENGRMPEIVHVPAEAATADGLLGPMLPTPGFASPGVEELIRSVTKFEQQERERMIDVFE